MVLSRVSSLCVTLAVASCGGNALNVGSTDGGPDSGASTGPVWNGTISGAQLQDGSNRLTMTLSLATGGRATGTLLLGNGALLLPAMDADAGYPPGAMFRTSPGSPLGFFEGFRYPMSEGSATGSSLMFRIAEYDLWAQWCSLQTKSYPWPGLGIDGGLAYGCLPNTTSSTGPAGCTVNNLTSTAAIPVDCGKLALCGADTTPCDCTATGCRGSMTSEQLYIDFDLVISGSHADGTMSGALGDHPVHFVRAP